MRVVFAAAAMQWFVIMIALQLFFLSQVVEEVWYSTDHANSSSLFVDEIAEEDVSDYSGYSYRLSNDSDLYLS